MMPSRKSTVPVLAASPPPAAVVPALRSSSVSSRPAPGWMMLPTTRPMARATVDITRKYPRARPPTLPTLVACRTDPIPSTIVQKMIGLIIILIRLTKPVPRGLSLTAKSGAAKPTTMPSTTATMTAIYRYLVRSRGRAGAGASGWLMVTPGVGDSEGRHC